MNKARTTQQLHRREAKNARRRARQAARACAVAALAGGSLVAVGDGTAQAAFPGSNGLIALDKLSTPPDPALMRDIWTVDPNGTAPGTQTDVSGDPAIDQTATWAPDGKHIAYVSQRLGDPGPQVYVQADYLTPSTAAPVTASVGNSGQLAWSPDMAEIAFTKLGDIYAVDVVSGVERQITSSPSIDRNPTWSPDGRYIAFESNRNPLDPTDIDVWRVDASGTEVNPVDLTPATPTSAEHHPDYSPGGSGILFDSNRDAATGGSDIYGKLANTGTTTYRLTSNASNDTVPGFSPDGRKFTFMSDRGDATSDIWTQNLIPDTYTQANPLNYTQDADSDRNPDWQPVGGMCPTDTGSGHSKLPPLPVDPSYPLTTTDVQNGTGASGGGADNDGAGGGSSDGGHVTSGDSSQGGTGNPCPGGTGGGSSDGGGGGGGGSSQ